MFDNQDAVMTYIDLENYLHLGRLGLYYDHIIIDLNFVNRYIIHIVAIATRM